jgi:hypothetical protein
MKVVNVGHDNLILTEYNGIRFAFHKGIPVEIEPRVYNEIIVSGFVNAQDIIPVAETEVKVDSEETSEDEEEQIESEVEAEETYTGPTPKVKKLKRKKGR